MRYPRGYPHGISHGVSHGVSHGITPWDASWDIPCDIPCDIPWDFPSGSPLAYFMERNWNGGVTVGAGTVVLSVEWCWKGYVVKRTVVERRIAKRHKFFLSWRSHQLPRNHNAKVWPPSTVGIGSRNGAWYLRWARCLRGAMPHNLASKLVRPHIFTDMGEK